MCEERGWSIRFSEVVDRGHVLMDVGHQLGRLGIGLLCFCCHKEVCSFCFKCLLNNFCLNLRSVAVHSFRLHLLHTCSSTRPPIFPLAVTKAVTSSSISLSKSSIDRGRGSSGAGGEADATAAPPAAPATAPAAAAAPAAAGAPLGSGVEVSTVEAISSSREVAASSLGKL